MPRVKFVVCHMSI